MRAFCIILTLSLVLSLSSCSGGSVIGARDMMALVEEALGDMPYCRYVYYMGAPKGSRFELDDNLFSLLYYGQKHGEAFEKTLLCDYAIRLSDKDCMSEVHILKVRARSDVDTVYKLVRRRTEYLKNRSVYLFSPANYEKYASSAEAYAFGNYVFFLATSDNELALETLKKAA